MISEYLVVVWSHSSHWGHTSVKYMECDTYDQAKALAKREAEYMDIIGRDYDIDIYIKTALPDKEGKDEVDSFRKERL